MEENYNNILATSETDRLIAEKVMGWKRKIPLNENYKNCVIWETGSPYIDGIRYTFSDIKNIDVWQPSSNIAAAWEVIEKIQDEFSFILSRDDPPTDDAHKWYCELYAKKEPFIDYEVYAPTAPLAICRVALIRAIYKQK